MVDFKATVKACVDRDILSFDSVVDSSKETIMKTILDKIHKYKITRTSDGRYTTRIPDPMKPKGTRQVRKTTLSGMFDFLIEFYGIAKPQQKGSEGAARGGLTFTDLFLKWVEYKSMFIGAKNRHKGLSPSTIKRYKRDYDRFFKGNEIETLRVRSITKPDLERFITGLIDEFNLKEKNAGNLIGYIADMFSFAYESDLIDRNPAAKLDRGLLLSRCESSVFDESSRILTFREIELLCFAIKQHESVYSYTPDYAIELALLTGMRVGEIAALRWDCIRDGYIYVDYSEHRLDYDDHTELIIGEPKCGKHRLIPLTDEMRNVLERVKALNFPSPEGFVFVTADGRRCSGHDISCACSRRGKEAGIKHTVSIHRIRRTVSSQLHAALPDTAVAAILGHTERVNKECYTYDVSDYRDKQAALGNLPQTGKIVPFRIAS